MYRYAEDGNHLETRLVLFDIILKDENPSVAWRKELDGNFSDWTIKVPIVLS
jgi:hypothetical protein